MTTKQRRGSHLRKGFMAGVLLVQGLCALAGAELRYLQAARNWNEALPLGNGRLGAMVFGGVETERLQLNEDTIWTGGPITRGKEELTREQIGKVRQLALSGKGKAAAKLLPQRCKLPATYQTFGDLMIRTRLPEGKTTDYLRTLSLDDAVHRTSFTRGGVKFLRETFSSFTDNTVFHRLTSDAPGAISFEVAVETPQTVTRTVAGDTLVIRGRTGASHLSPGGLLAFEGRVTVRTTGGEVKVADGKITVTGADAATVYATIATNYRNFRDLTGDPGAKTTAALAAATGKSYDAARADHVRFYRGYADRCTLRLGRADDSSAQPTDARFRAFAKTNDPAFAALYFRYCRYLLISSSQPGTEPINLMGIWTNEMKPAWGANYVLNINEQMIYWPAEATGLGDLAEPLWRMCDELAVTGADYAHDVYGAPGWVTHHGTDPWRKASPNGHITCALWPSGGTWLVQHIWYHWLYTHDREFLRRHYATLKGAADFCASQLVRNPKSGKFTICPSLSPENPVGGNWRVAPIQRGAAMDHALLRDLFGAVAEATEILGGDAAYAKKMRETAAEVEPFRIGRWGQLQEWSDDVDRPTDRHRHTSHLYAVYPSNQITPETPELFAAAKTSLEHRGDESTGWALAWRMNLWARLQDGERAYLLFRNLMRPAISASFKNYREVGGTYDNLLNSCPPFVIDGNLGSLAGMVEMLLQTHRGCIDLLPALPRAWPEGRVAGLRAPHGFGVEIVWKDGRLETARITSDLGEPCTVRYADRSLKLTLKKGETATLTRQDFETRGTAAPSAVRGTALGKIRTAEYKALRERMARGWNTWYNGSMTTHVLLPEGFAVNFGLAANRTFRPIDRQHDFLKYSEKLGRPESIRPGLRTEDGRYTSADIALGNFGVRIETATDGDDLVALVTPRTKSKDLVVADVCLPFGSDGLVGKSGDRLVGEAGGRRFTVSMTAQPDPAVNVRFSSPRLCARLDRGPVGFFTGRERSLAEIRALINSRRTEQEQQAAAYGARAEAFKAMKSVLCWNTIYDPDNRRAITVASRCFNNKWGGGWILFDWDTYFAVHAFSLFNRDLAYVNAIEVTKSITKAGFIPNYTCAFGKTNDRSQPPVGSWAVWTVYEKYRDRWFLEEVYDELLSWNRWWSRNRDIKGYLAWGSFDMVGGRRVARNVGCMCAESGIDNSPTFDGVPANKELGVMMQADVGLMSMYVKDCRMLAKIADELGRADEAAELRTRAERYGAKLETLWCEEKGIYMNRRLDTGKFNPVLSPCNFYPLFTGTCPKEHAERMVREHYFNPQEFHGEYVLPSVARNCKAFMDNDYFRGRIWAPMNLLVYFGLRESHQDKARADLVRRSYDLMIRNLRKTGGIYENYNAVTGEGGDVLRSDAYYYWGSFLGFLGILEDGSR